jgi:hypothetical protein
VGSFFVSLKINIVIRVVRIYMSVGKVLESEVFAAAGLGNWSRGTIRKILPEM